MLKVQMNKPQQTTDDEIVNYHVMQKIKRGCNECGSHSFAYEAGVKEENELKWFVILVDCGACGKAYEEIMEVRVINEPIKHAESE